VIPVQQTTFRPSAGDGAGNCLAAALASLLELRLKQVPNFSAIEGEELDDQGRRPWFAAVEDWLAELGYGLVIGYPSANAPWYSTQRAHLLISGKSPRGDFSHTVIGRVEGDKVVFVHDPHPSGDFIEGEATEIWAVVRL
jgi:hypothetical protein